ncbi:MAG: hypothetical protein V3U02_04430 [Calditrichia bacterium]
MDKIIREFTVVRSSGHEQIYPFTTFSSVLSANPAPQNNQEKLFLYLKSVFNHGIKSEAKKTVTEFPKLLIKSQLHTPDHECDKNILALTSQSGWEGQGNRQHEIVQNKFFQEDPFTIALEVPVWDEEMTGRIDIVRIKDKNTIQILDFKPNAFRDKTAPSQLYRYRKLLSKLTGIPLKNIEVLYFDSKTLMEIIL